MTRQRALALTLFGIFFMAAICGTTPGAGMAGWCLFMCGLCYGLAIGGMVRRTR
jgi:hypothetical protein